MILKTHNTLRLNSHIDTEFYKDFYAEYVNAHIQIDNMPFLNKPAPDEGAELFEGKIRDNNAYFGSSNLTDTLDITFPGEIQTPVNITDITKEKYNKPDNILVFSWIDFTSLSSHYFELLFQQYKGKILIDDSFESCPIRNNAMENLLRSYGVDISQIAFLTNCIRKDLVVKEGIHYRNDWLHLTLIDQQQKYRDVKHGSVLQLIDNFNELLDYDNKINLFFSLNGHSTNMRMALITSMYVNDAVKDITRFRYSLKEVSVHDQGVIEYLKYTGLWKTMPFEMGEALVKQLSEQKHLPGDTAETGRLKDFYVDVNRWTETFYNINVDTNQVYFSDDWVNISEKWMKQILYLTPGININEYTGLEQHHKNLGFLGYDNFWDHSYDSCTNQLERVKMVADIVKHAQPPTKTEWKEMCNIAQYNRNHFFKYHIPKLRQSLKDTLQNIVNQ